MLQMLAKSMLLLILAVAICCGIYPAALWAVGKIFFPEQARGSLIVDFNNKIIGSKLIAQPFTKDEYFQPRPSAASYNAAASAASSLAVSNYALRDRAARALGPVVKYAEGPRAGQPAAPDIEAWFKQDFFQGKKHLVAQWAVLHPLLARAWVNADPAHAAFVGNWAKSHPAQLAQFIRENPAVSQPKPADLAVIFFQNFSKNNPGKFPVITNGKSEIIFTSADKGHDIQSIFFDMWREDHPTVRLQPVPGDWITTSASGLAPYISLQNAEFQLDRVAARWAENLQRDPSAVKNEIEKILQEHAVAPLGGLAGEKIVNVLEVNVALRKHYEAIKP